MAWDVPATDLDRKAFDYDWGVTWPGWPDWPWTTRIRILLVTDGRITTGRGANEFGLGLVLDTLTDISFAWWVRFDITYRDRDTGFRFTEAGFDIDRYDQIWFFGDWPGEEANEPDFPDSRIEDDGFEHMEPGELAAIAAWMNAGGGVFATGDHALLGASMCHKIPRVRSMRKWTRAQGVPPFDGPSRHETLQGLPAIDEYAAEGDRYPQRIYPLFRSDSNWPYVFGQWPHPILCGKDGVIDEFPDHMHEGAVIEDDDVVLTDKLLPGSQADEYPMVPIVVASGVAAGPIGGGPETLGSRPRPQVIAHGMTTNPEQARRAFGLVGVYDGNPAGVGRVVVDSTWHHWFSMNLVGLRDEAPGFYRNMQAYYRNVGLWLASPAQRASMLFWATWGALVGSQPGLFHPALGVYGMGKRAIDVLGRTAPQCIVSELVGPVIESLQVREALRDRPTAPWDELTRPPAAMVNQAIVGGIAAGMFDLAKQHIEERARGRTPRIEPEEIRAAGAKGIEIGMGTLRSTLATAAQELGALADEDRSKGYRDIVEGIQVGEMIVPEADTQQQR
jgi:hypothetical protein